MKNTFIDIKDRLNDPAVLQILAACLFDASPAGIDRKAAEYRRQESREFFGMIENGKILGICGFENCGDYVEILHIAIDENTRNCGVGTQMVRALADRFRLPIKAETDADAVDFYRKVGFETTETRKYDTRRWVCLLHHRQ